jgi:TetR/AcrR family transcriptional regulator, transcriptional repressor for nem operon
MKVSREKMAEHREKIISSASRRFRERGFEGIGVADLMKEAGLTHGGFYGHFDSKEELVELATERALHDSAAKWERILAEETRDPMQTFGRQYLSLQHWRNPGTGCLFASLGGEVGRQSATVRNRVTEGIQRMIELLGIHTRGKTEAVRRRKAISAYASVIGGMILARSTSDQTLAEEILDAVAESLPRLTPNSPAA